MVQAQEDVALAKEEDICSETRQAKAEHEHEEKEQGNGDTQLDMPAHSPKMSS